MEETHNCSIWIKYDCFVVTNKTQQPVIVICFSTLLSLETILAMLEQPLEMGGAHTAPSAPLYFNYCRSSFYKQLYSVVQLRILLLT